MMPRPPALDTADASCARAIQPIGRLDDRVLDAEEVGDSGAHGGSLAAQRTVVTSDAIAWAASSAGTAKPRRSVSAASSARMCAGSAGGPVKWPCMSAQPERPELDHLLLRLDALGDARQTEAVREARDRGDDRAVLGVHRHALHERTIDLDHVDRELAHEAERREARAEVVEREAHAEQLHLAQAGPCRDRVEEQRALGELEAEQRRAQPSRGQRAGDRLAKVGLGQLASAHVHRDLRAELGERVRPLRGLPARLAKHPRAHVDDEPGLLQLGDEVAGDTSPRSGWSQRINASSPTIEPSKLEHDGLVDEPELPCVERDAQLLDAPDRRARPHG